MTLTSLCCLLVPPHLRYPSPVFCYSHLIYDILLMLPEHQWYTFVIWGVLLRRKTFPVAVSQWYVYPRDMCIPVHISLVICVSLQYDCQWNVYPLPPTSPSNCRFYFCCFCAFCESSSKGLQMIQDYGQHNRQKSIDSRQNNRKAVSGEFTSSSVRGPQCW